MATSKPLVLSAILQNIEVEGDFKNEKRRARSQYFVQLNVDNKLVVKSTKSKPLSSVHKWEWNADNKIWFDPSSTMKIVLYRGFGTSISLLDDLVGQYEGKVVDFLVTDASFDLKDKKGKVAFTTKIVLSRISGSADKNVKEFMEKIDADVSRLSSHGTVLSTASTLGQVLSFTKSIMDQLSQAHPILNASWTVVSGLYEAVQETEHQDASVRELASTLRELIGTASKTDLPEMPNMINVIEEISRQSLQVASLISEYTKLSWAGRTVKIPAGLKSRIEGCQQSCADLKDRLFGRIQLDTNIQVNQIKRTLGTMNDDKLGKDIRNWLSPPNYSQNYYEAKEKHQVTTCSWFLDGEQFRQWQANPGFLWVKGKAGSGKSILSSSIIKQLSENNSTPIAYFFFDGRDSQSELQRHNKLMRSLISQFAHQHDGIPAKLAELYKYCGDHKQPSDDELQDTLRDILDGFSHAYIVIDALDECTNREKTLNWVKLVIDTDLKVENLHIVVTSRPEQDIEEVFMMFDPHAIDIGEAAANRDISNYLKLQMGLKFKRFPENTRKQIGSELGKHADGSFRWVALQIAELEKCQSDYEIKQQLKKLPKDLEDIYKRMLKAIDETYRADTVTFLQWLAFSRRPMKIAEIAETITVDFDSKDGPVFNADKRYYNPQDMLVRCSGLVSESGGTIKLSHFSVKEYLLSSRIETNFGISEKTSHSRISEISIAYLLQFHSFEPLAYTMSDSSPLAQYAAEHWIEHAKSGGMDPAVLKLILQLFKSETAFLTNWIRRWNIDASPFLRRGGLIGKAQVHSPLYYASLAGLEQVVYYLLEEGADMNAQGGSYGNPLQGAASEGHKAIVKMLLKNRANVNAKGGKYGNALQGASFAGHEAVVNVLLENGADVDAQGGEFGNALQAASFSGHEAVIKVLLEKGADVNAQGGRRYVNALQAASFAGQEAVIKVLLEKGADVNTQGGYYGNALQAASFEGHKAVIKVLLEKGAEVNAQGGYCGNALQAASYQDHEAVVKILLEKGAEVNAEGGANWNALHAASVEGNKEIVMVLLDKGADVNAQGGEYGNALYAAVHGGDEATMMVLLEKGADVNAQGGDYGNALQLASSLGGYEGIVKVLLKKGADVNAQGGYYGNALQAASFTDNEEIVKVLLESGADVNAQGGEYETALQAAEDQGYDAIVKMLQENGALTNVSSES